MSKERARRRAEREEQAAKAADERARHRAAAERRQARRDRLARLLPTRPARPGRSGLLAARRRRIVGLVAVGFCVVQFLTFVATPDWGARAAVFVASLFALPVLAALSAPSR